MTGHPFWRATSIWVGALSVLLVAAACSDASGPDLPAVISVAVTQFNGPDISDNGTDQLVQCQLDLQASGVGAARATWGNATLFFYAGSDRRKPVDSVTFSATQIQNAWGARDIGPGETQQSILQVSASIPFSGAMVYRFDGGGRVGSTRLAFDCGLPVPANPHPPTISGVTIDPTGTEVESGSALTVHYVAESNIGLWTTGVQTSGACSVEQTFPERLVLTSEHTVVLTIPPTCPLGGSVTVAVIATNSAMQRTTLSVQRPYRVVDHTPPVMYADYLPTANNYFFAGDTLRPFIAAQDNYAVRTIIWEVAPFGVRDSIAGDGGRYVDIPLRPEWSGSPVQIRLFARDVSGLVSDTLVAPMQVYPTASRPTRSATIAGDIQDLVVDDRRGALYLVQAQTGARIGVLSLATLTITETIPLPVLAWDMDLTAGGDSLVIALPYVRALGIIDLRQSSKAVTLLPIQSLDTTTGQAPWGVRIGANGKAYVKLDGPTPAPSGILEVDLATGTERLLTGFGDVSGARFERSFDHSVLVLSRGASLLQRYDVALDAVSPVHAPQSVYGPLRVDGAGGRVTLGLDVFDGSLDFLRRVTSIYGGEAVPGSALSVDGAFLYQALGYRGVGRARTSDGTVVDRVRIPFAASGYLRISPDGNTLVVVDSFLGTAQIALVDLR